MIRWTDDNPHPCELDRAGDALVWGLVAFLFVAGIALSLGLIP